MAAIPFPVIDVTAHLSADDVDARLAASPPSPLDEGTVTLLCARPASHERALFERVRLDHKGMPSDRWQHGKAKPAMQLAVMEHRVAVVVANGQSMALFGDNIALDLDLSAANLPIGSLVVVGDATVTVTPEPHTGCKQYAARFGVEALRFISAREREHLCLRGVYFQVRTPGDVWIGAPVRVVRRGPGDDDDGDGSGQQRLL